MAESNYQYQGFISALQYRISHRATLANTIADILAIDKDAVYRRLRGEVTFSFIEMAAIAKNLGISLDSIVGIESSQSKPSQVIMTKHVNPTEHDYRMFKDFVNLLKFIKDEPNTKLMESGNVFPFYLFFDFDYFSRFYIFYWNRAGSFGKPLPFHEIIIPEQYRVLQKKCSLYARHIKSTIYVWEHTIFQRLVENIKFFARIRVIKEEDISLLKNELSEFLNHVEKLAVKGKHEDTGNEVFIYISDLSIETNYNCIKSKNSQTSLFRAFLLNANAALDEEVFDEVNAWISYHQRMSTLISVSGEKFRADFFEKQRIILSGL
jgi:hypothetical protein